MELKRLKELKELYERPTEQELEKEQEELLNEINYVLQLHIPVVIGSVVCDVDYFNMFTKGKEYKILENKSEEYVLINDFGRESNIYKRFFINEK